MFRDVSRRRARRRSPARPRIRRSCRRESTIRPASRRPDGNDDDERAQRRAGRDAKRVGRRERVPQQRLKDDARDREAAADQRGREHARQPGDEEDLRVDVVAKGNRPVEDPRQPYRRAADEGSDERDQQRRGAEGGDGDGDSHPEPRSQAAGDGVSPRGQPAPPSDDPPARASTRPRRCRRARGCWCASGRREPGRGR